MTLVIPTYIVRGLRYPEPSSTQFHPTTFIPAESKLWFARHFLRFVSADFPKHHFTIRFYRQVMNSFGFIAHYNISGFWTEYFTSLSGKVEFLEEILDWPRYGDPTSSFCDVESEIARRVQAVDLLGFYRSALRSERDAAERATYARLKAKFEPGATAESARPVESVCLPPTKTRAAEGQAQQLDLGIG